MACKGVRTVTAPQPAQPQQPRPQQVQPAPVDYKNLNSTQVSETAGYCAIVYFHAYMFYTRSGNSAKAKEFADGAPAFFDMAKNRQAFNNAAQAQRDISKVAVETEKSAGAWYMENWLRGQIESCRKFRAAIVNK